MDQFINREQIEKYDIVRPKYTEEIFKDINSRVKGNDLYLDIACGTGQMLIPLSERFTKSIGVDVSTEQINKARTNVDKMINSKSVYIYNLDVYDISSKLIEENIVDCAEGSFDLITIGQAFHWFDEEKVLSFVKSLLKPNGLLVIAGYSKQHFSQKVNPELHSILDKTINELIPYFEMDVDNNENGYYKSYPNFNKYYSLVERIDYTECKEEKLQSIFDLIQSFSAYINYKKNTTNDEILPRLKQNFQDYFNSSDNVYEEKILYHNFYFILHLSN